MSLVECVAPLLRGLKPGEAGQQLVRGAPQASNALPRY